eukprot:8408715-Ditylum_brightwellii.AAC.1
MVETRHNKAATTICFVATIKNTQQSTSSVLMKKEMKRQKKGSDRDGNGHDSDGHDGDSDKHDSGGNNHDR